MIGTVSLSGKAECNVLAMVNNLRYCNVCLGSKIESLFPQWERNVYVVFRVMLKKEKKDIFKKHPQTTHITSNTVNLFLMKEMLIFIATYTEVSSVQLHVTNLYLNM